MPREALLRKMVAIPDVNSMRHYLTEVGDYNGVLCASNGIIGAAIYPTGRPSWNLSDAFIAGACRHPDAPKEIGKRPIEVETGRLDLTGLFSRIISSGQVQSFSSNEIKAIINECQQQQKIYKTELSAMSQDIRRKKPRWGEIGIDFDKRMAVHVTKVDEGEYRTNYRINSLLDVLKFIRCADTSEVHIYYTDYHNPTVIQAENLYALISPIRVVR